MATYISNDSPTFFYIVTVLFCIVLIVVLALTAANYNTVSRLVLPEDEIGARTTRRVRTSASAMMWVCIIMAIVAAIILFWTAYKLITRKSVTINRDLNSVLYGVTTTGTPTSAQQYVDTPTYVRAAVPLDDLVQQESINYLVDL